MTGLLRRGLLGIPVLAAAALCAAGLAEEPLFIKAGRIVTMVGPPLADGVIVIQDGKIARLGPREEAPEGARVIDAGNGVVMPGLVDISARFAFRGEANEESSEVTATFCTRDAVDRGSKALKRALQLGVTALRAVPGNANVIAGTGVAMKTEGRRLEEMVLAEDDGLKLVMGDEASYGNIPVFWRPWSFYFRQPTTRMGVVWVLRQTLFRVQQAMRAGAEIPPEDRPIAQVLQGKRPVEVEVRTAVDIETIFRVADEFGLKRLVFVECTEGYKMAPEIARRNVPVVLGPLYYYAQTRPQFIEGWDVSWNNAGLLARAGVKTAFASNDPSGPADLRLSAMMAARCGLAEEQALRAITTNPAEIAGLADRVGSLSKGKDADLLILSGDPLRPTSRVERVIVSGRIAFEAPGATPVITQP